MPCDALAASAIETPVARPHASPTPSPGGEPGPCETIIGGSVMSRSVNKITLIGNVGRDPDIQQTKSGTKVAHFSLATNRRAPAGAEEEERTDWHRLTLWSRQAQFAEEYIRTGDRIYIEGRLEYDSYERDGVVIPTAEINVSEVVLLTSKGKIASEEMEAAA
jgi:single-strand DNA-binding protein